MNNDIPVSLTYEQEEHLKSMLWFINGPLRSGKTLVTACAIVLSARGNPEKHIGIFSTDRETDGEMIRYVCGVINLVEDADNFEVNFTDKTLVYREEEDEV